MYYYEMIEAFQVQTATFSATTQLTIPDLANERQGDHARAAELPFRVTSPSNILISIHANIITMHVTSKRALGRIKRSIATPRLTTRQNDSPFTKRYQSREHIQRSLTQKNNTIELVALPTYT